MANRTETQREERRVDAMWKNLYCPVCGFSFGAGVPDNISAEELTEVMTCPCGQLMEEVDELKPMEFEPMEVE